MIVSRKLTKLFVFFFALAFAAESEAGLCDHSYEFCGYVTGNRNSTTPASPTKSSSININPSAVPIEKGFGVETIAYKGAYDFSIVKGLGRVGAAISPSNTEETFFGPPGFELPEDFLERKIERNKYPSQKLTLATAFNIYENKKKDLKRFELNLGIMGKYNKVSSKAYPGAGITGIAGPITFGYSVYGDEFVIDYNLYGLDRKSSIQYAVETYSVGVFLSSIAIDYSVLRLVASDVATVSLLTATLVHRWGLFTIAARRELSNRPAYDYTTKTLESREKKEEAFAGAQVSLGKYFMVGGFYNYYALRELSLGATLFF